MSKLPLRKPFTLDKCSSGSKIVATVGHNTRRMTAGISKAWAYYPDPPFFRLGWTILRDWRSMTPWLIRTGSLPLFSSAHGQRLRRITADLTSPAAAIPTRTVSGQ